METVTHRDHAFLSLKEPDLLRAQAYVDEMWSYGYRLKQVA